MLESIDSIIDLATSAWAWFLTRPLPIRILVGAAGLAVLWVLWIVLRVTLFALRILFRIF